MFTPPLRRLRPLVSGLVFERRLGVETSRSVQTDELGYDDERHGFYQPSEWRTLQRALPRRLVGPDDVFIDIGSGMGRMVLRAAQYPFKRVIGVELSPQLHAVAVRNLQAIRRRLRCKNVQLVQANATDFEVPDDVTVVFFNNPFWGEVFDAAVQSVLRSVERRPRPLRVLYRNPVEHDRLMATGRFRVEDDRQMRGWRGRKVGVVIRRYQVLATGTGRAEAVTGGGAS